MLRLIYDSCFPKAVFVPEVLRLGISLHPAQTNRGKAHVFQGSAQFPYNLASESPSLGCPVRHKKADKGCLGIGIGQNQIQHRKQAAALKKTQIIFVLRLLSRWQSLPIRRNGLR